MVEVFDWQTVADPYALVRRVVEVLGDGRLVALPTETGHALAASGLAPEAVRVLGEVAGQLSDPPDLAVRGAAEARDWAPDLGRLGQRLCRRFWPGPLTLLVGGAEQGLAGRLDERVRAAVCPDGRVRLRAPAHEAALEVLRHLPGPLVLAPVERVEGLIHPPPSTLHPPPTLELIVDDGPSHYRQPPTVVQIDGDSWQVVRPGVISAELLQRHSACTIVFVCTGNTCRSPLAEALFKKRLADRLGCTMEELPARGFCVRSAGLAAMMGGGAAPEAVEVARRYGADLGGHASQPLTAELAAQADYLVTMTRSHARSVQEQYPRLGIRPRLLDPEGEDVADPIGCPQAVYEACGEQIWRHLEALVAEVQPAAAQEQPEP